MARPKEVNPDDIKAFEKALEENRWDLCALAYIIWPFGEPGSDLEHIDLFKWQFEELDKFSKHLQNPETRYDVYRFICSSGNGSAKTTLGALINIIMLYTHKLKARITANTDTQMSTAIWPNYDLWIRRARFHEHFFNVQGESIHAKNEKLSKNWRIDRVNWDDTNPASISGLHNAGHAVGYTFEEGPGIPAVVWDYTRGSFLSGAGETIKYFLAFGNSDDPNSKFEQNMNSQLWHSLRIDTRTLDHTDKKEIDNILYECNGDEDHDEFRVRVRGLPRKSNKDSIINAENVIAAISRGGYDRVLVAGRYIWVKRENFEFDDSQYSVLPVILTCDPAWKGGDETTIWMHQGPHSRILERFKLDRENAQETHQKTYERLCHWERHYKADAVNIDQAEGTALYTLAINAGKTSWMLFSFATALPKEDPLNPMYFNNRAMMYYETDKRLREGGIITSEKVEWLIDVESQLSLTKGTRHKATLKKLAAPKEEIRAEYHLSPDLADGLVLERARKVYERLPENAFGGIDNSTGQTALKMPEQGNPYEGLEQQMQSLYD